MYNHMCNYLMCATKLENEGQGNPSGYSIRKWMLQLQCLQSFLYTMLSPIKLTHPSLQ
jgi:hypothetical protein